MAFHETFWVVTATTAPVVVVALAVSVSDVLFVYGKRTAEISERWRSSKARNPRDFGADPRWSHDLRIEWTRFRWVRRSILGSFILQGAILGASLQSLVWGKDNIPPEVMLWMTVVGVFSVGGLQGLAAGYRASIPQSSPPAETSDNAGESPAKEP